MKRLPSFVPPRPIRRSAGCALLACCLALPPALGGEQPGPVEVDIGAYLKGRAVYERNCMVCHGEKGDGKGEMAGSFVPPPRSFREGLFKFRSTPYGKLPADSDLRRTITGGLSGTNMGKFANLSDGEVDAVVGYLKFFSRRWKKSENFAAPLALPPVPEWFGKPAAQEHAGPGRAVFLAYCAGCHGSSADGHGPAAPHLTDVWGKPVPPPDLRQPFPRCGDKPEDLYRLVSTGMNGTPMAGYEETLTPGQRWDLAAFLLKIRLPAGPTLDGAGDTK